MTMIMVTVRITVYICRKIIDSSRNGGYRVIFCVESVAFVGEGSDVIDQLTSEARFELGQRGGRFAHLPLQVVPTVA